MTTLSLVAGPVLRNSERLNENDLIEATRSKIQQHLFAIAQRKTLTEAVTDVLVTRGDQHVARAVVRNEGARFSEKGFWNLVKRSKNDSILAECVGVRKDIPRHLFLQLIAKASDVAQQRLASVAPAARDQIQHAVADATGRINSRFGPASKEYYAAKRLVTELHQSGELDENELYAFAKAKKFEETTVAFALLCSVSPDVAERALIEDTPEMVLILRQISRAFLEGGLVVGRLARRGQGRRQGWHRRCLRQVLPADDSGRKESVEFL